LHFQGYGFFSGFYFPSELRTQQNHLAFRFGESFLDRVPGRNLLIQLCSHFGGSLCCLLTAKLGSVARPRLLGEFCRRHLKLSFGLTTRCLGNLLYLYFQHQFLAHHMLGSLRNRLGSLRKFPRFDFMRELFAQPYCLVSRHFESDAGGEIRLEKALIFSGGPPKRSAKAECQRGHRSKRIGEI
jgi:hypothetical protein